MGLIVAIAPSLHADDAVDYDSRDAGDLQKLVAPVALYPDALLAQVLAASTYPDDVMAAAHWEDAGNNPAAIDSQPWDSSVKGVARYPSVLHYMANNADWMNDLGDAFLHQQGDVMSAVQDMRSEAVAAGTLTTTPQQTVVNADGYIQIIPTNPDILYAPAYDPNVVYSPPDYVGGETYTPYITFGLGVDVGDWLDFDLDWHDRSLYHGLWGHDRPWWHDHGQGYLDTRPGHFVDAGHHPGDWAGGHWARDDHRPAPHPVARGAAPVGRADRGYPTAAVARPSGAEVAHESERGQSSREVNAHPAPEVIRGGEPSRGAAVHEEPRQAAPVAAPRGGGAAGGGVMGGYSSGAEASHFSERGAGSRGGGGAGEAGHSAGGGGAAAHVGGGGGGGGGGGAAHGGGGGGGHH